MTESAEFDLALFLCLALLMRLVVILILLSYQSATAQFLRLSTPSDSAIYFYYEGWRQVMDEGNYSKAEIAYRKMMVHDPDFLIGLSLLGRITKDLDERKQIELRLENRKQEVHGDERLLLNTFIDLVKLTNEREMNPDEAKLQLEKVFKLGEQRLFKLVHKYPDEVYYKAEYIEVLHRNHGAAVALDSLYVLASKEQQNLPFLTGYSASMEAEIGHFDNALKKAESLFEILDQQSPKPYVVHGDIYYKMGNFDKAHEFVIKALTFDPENIDALRLKSKISSELNKK